jgi:AcrR family transcriptional regulator
MPPVSKGVVIALAEHVSRSRAASPKRADARRNYDQLVEQARITFAESGVDASLDEIARRAGVASGTLYRHFPTRLDLIEAVLAGQIAELADLGRGLLTAEDEFGALFTWLRAAIMHALTYRGLSAAVMNSALDGANGLVSAWHAELFEVGAALLARTRQSGALAADADDADVLRMIGAIAWAAQDAADSPAQADRLLALFMNGVRHRALGPGLLVAVEDVGAQLWRGSTDGRQDAPGSGRALRPAR